MSSRRKQRRTPPKAGALGRVRQNGGLAIAETVRAGAERYDRKRHLPWLARATPSEIASADPEATQAIVERLTRALRAERRRGRANHWAYDINRHIALLQALSAERKRLDHIARSRRFNSRNC